MTDATTTRAMHAGDYLIMPVGSSFTATFYTSDPAVKFQATAYSPQEAMRKLTNKLWAEHWRQVDAAKTPFQRWGERIATAVFGVAMVAAAVWFCVWATGHR